MFRLQRYLFGLFFVQSFALFMLVAILVWLSNTLRIFDLITAKGQGPMTLLGQAGLMTPEIAKSLLGVTFGIGIARALHGLQQSRELHTIHVSSRLRALFSAVGLFSLFGALAIFVISGWVNPASKVRASDWTAEIAADLFNRTLPEKRFTQVSDRVIVYIGEREPGNVMSETFIHDGRDPELTQTYFARRAYVVSDINGQQLQLEDGWIATVGDGDAYSEVSFSRYAVSLGGLIQPPSAPRSVEEKTNSQLWAERSASGGWEPQTAQELHARLAESVRIPALALLTIILFGFPHARRGRWQMPPEPVVLSLAIVERAFSSALAGTYGLGNYCGSGILVAVALLVLWWRTRGHLIQVPEAAS